MRTVNTTEADNPEILPNDVNNSNNKNITECKIYNFTFRIIILLTLHIISSGSAHFPGKNNSMLIL